MTSAVYHKEFEGEKSFTILRGLKVGNVPFWRYFSSSASDVVFAKY